MSETLRAVLIQNAAAGLLNGWPRSDVLALAGVLIGAVGSIAAVIAIVPQTRPAALRFGCRVLLRSGLFHHRYAKWFASTWGVYANPYLGEYENLDLRSTYVPLSFLSGDEQSLMLASQVLASRAVDRLIIVGDPGSGKSTLLKAYGAGLLQSRREQADGSRIVPYYIQLRKLAKFLAPDKGLAGYIMDEILVREGVMGPVTAGEFLRYTLSRRQAVMMLDGLDEIPDDLQRRVLTAVLYFARDKTRRRPTERARILLTCRTQNFEKLGTSWVPAFVNYDSLYALAPLRDSEISSYLRKFQHKFNTADGPARFMKSVRDAKTIDLLRAPLILAMCVGLYAARPTMIPSTISELYGSMIRDMLERHSFLDDDPDDSVLVYATRDKYSFLRKFALDAVRKSGEFGEFTRADLVDFFRGLVSTFDEIDDPKGFVAEIIKHSGLLSDVDDNGRYIFAHRSIQEFLAAEELRQLGGDQFLIAKANDLHWQQTIQFYTAGRVARQIDEFLRELAACNVELAGYCLQAAKPSDDAARAVLDALEPVTTDARLKALAAASRSSQPLVRKMAIEQLKGVIVATERLLTLRPGIEGMLPLLDSLAGTNAAEIAALVPNVIRHLADDARLVGPLWQCLNAPDIELRTAECSAIVERLLMLAMDPGFFTELERQDPHDRDFLTGIRSQAYPLRHGLRPEHNLVTLLAWADYMRVTPQAPNRFFEAKVARRLERLEADHRRTVSFSLCWPARILSAAELLAASAIAIYVLITHPGLMLHPYGRWTMPLVYGTAIVGPVILNAMLTSIAEGVFSADSSFGRFFRGGMTESGGLLTGPGNFVSLISDSGNGLMYAALAWLIITAPVSALPVMSKSLGGYYAVALGAEIIFMLTNNHAFDSGIQYYLYRPNEYVDAYDDPRSAHWLVLQSLRPEILRPEIRGTRPAVRT